MHLAITVAGSSDGGVALAPAFSCRDTAGGRFLAERAYAEAPAHAAIVVDFVRTGGVPRCQGTGILSWCSDHSCLPIDGQRRCFDVALPGEPARAREELAAALGALDGQLVSADAPSEAVLVRVLATAERCADITSAAPSSRAFDTSRLLGCAYSCPVSLDSTAGEVVLDLDFAFVEGVCAIAVTACAGTPIRPPGTPGGTGGASCARLAECCDKLPTSDTMMTCRLAASGGDEAICALGLGLEQLRIFCPEAAQ